MKSEISRENWSKKSKNINDCLVKLLDLGEQLMISTQAQSLLRLDLKSTISNDGKNSLYIHKASSFTIYRKNGKIIGCSPFLEDIWANPSVIKDG